MQAGVGLLVTDVMPIYMIIRRYSHNYAQFYQLLDSNLFTHRNIFLSRENALVKPMAPGSIFHHISFRSTILVSYLFYFAIFTFQSIQQKYQKDLSYYLYHISLLQVVVKGLTTPLSRWLQGSYLFVQVLGDLCVVSYWIDNLVLKN